MGYIECKISLNPFRPFNEILVAQLGELNYESFSEVERESQLFAYIKEEEFKLKELQEICEQFQEQVVIHIETKQIKKENWNKKWEENFEPIKISDFCLVRAPFHNLNTDFKFELVIEPKMSFGTGHHQTTQLMIELMQACPIRDKVVLDMGSGTGILAILAKKMGAEQVDAIDIEEWAFENMQENAERNKVNMNCFLGDGRLLKNKNNCYDLVFANINRNILLNDMSEYKRVLKKDGILLLSGFFETDSHDILKSPFLTDFQCLSTVLKEGWCGLQLMR